MRRLRKDDLFDTLPPEAKAAVQADAGYTFMRCNKPAEAMPDLKAATAVTPEFWSTANLAALVTASLAALSAVQMLWGDFRGGPKGC